MNKIFVTQSSMPTYDEFCDEIKDIWISKWLTNNGKKHELLTEKLKEYLDCKNLTLFNNGHMALYTAIKSLKLTGEVITTPFTFASTTHAIVQNDLVPIFCDIRKDNYTIDADKIEELITDKTSAILAVHVYGNPCDVEKIQSIADKYNLKVIYDAAHAFGVYHNGESIVNYGDISMISFHATKVFNTIEGGALIYNDDSLIQKLNELKNFGIVDPEHVSAPGMNCKMNEFQAAMGLCNLKHIDQEILKRKMVFKKYIENLKSIKGLKIPELHPGVKHNYSYFPVVIEDEYGISRDELFDLLEKNGIYSRKYFYPLISDYDCYKDVYDSNLTPVAKNMSNRVLTLPMYADLDLGDVDRICKIIKKKK